MSICNVVIENSQQQSDYQNKIINMELQLQAVLNGDANLEYSDQIFKTGLINHQPLHISMAEYSDGFGQWILCIYKITWNTRRLEMITQTRTNYIT
ncbi:hypothetical protein T07_6866 [Trichinella nelsoni]|uniref:Uncharacterized protein n=1 Tax=Trichinella nelsoni TaxID=6336 RepID=A0A0V0RP04_9BILA|nr:hypothetical protein T07_6866 [Trichinella nelsoni]